MKQSHMLPVSCLFALSLLAGCSDSPAPESDGGGMNGSGMKDDAGMNDGGMMKDDMQGDGRMNEGGK